MHVNEQSLACGNCWNNKKVWIFYPYQNCQSALAVRRTITMSRLHLVCYLYWFGFHITFNTVQVISRWVVLWAEETSTCSWTRFCTVNCGPMASNYQLFSCSGFEVWTSKVGGECVTTVTPCPPPCVCKYNSDERLLSFECNSWCNIT